MRANRFASRSCWAMAVIGAAVLTANAKEPANPPAAAKSVKVAVASKGSADGRELFTREWLPNDSRSHGGDGLGPVFNDSSCVACHNQGGIGGGGAASKNVDIVTAFPQPTVLMPTAENTLPEALFNSLFGRCAAGPDAAASQAEAAFADGRRKESGPEAREGSSWPRSTRDSPRPVALCSIISALIRNIRNGDRRSPADSFSSKPCSVLSVSQT